ncbi:type VI secretion system Vgr family protein [Pseudomonas sp. X10]
MSESPQLFFDHRQHRLQVIGVKAPLDVLAFEHQEALSEPFTCRIEFTSSDLDIDVALVLNRPACFSLLGSSSVAIPGLPVPEQARLRVLRGVVTGFQRLAGSVDEARYALTLQPRLALLGRGCQYRIYQNKSVPEIVEHILRERHGFQGQDFSFDLGHDYPRREQVMQYGESDLAFIARLLAEVGICYRFTCSEKLSIDVVAFHDGQRGLEFGVSLPYRPQSGLSSTGQDGVWQLQSRHQVVEQAVSVRAYHHRDAYRHLDGEVDQTCGSMLTYGEAYHYAEPYTQLGDALARHEQLTCESGYFHARLRHDRYLNQQVRLSGQSSSASLAAGQVLNITGGAPQAFLPRVVITAVKTRAARDRSLEVSFEAMPYSEDVCFRPAVPPKPRIAGTLPARVTSTRKGDPYAHIDGEGRYRVNFLFDRDSWAAGQESACLRLARPYAGDTYGLHLPLLAGTEVAVAFEQGDPDRPYIAHALHDSRHPDHVTLGNYKRNVLRTPANNKLRLDDSRGQEHIKLSTEQGGKSQLNLGHLVNEKKHRRGEGFELRTDAWGAIRAGKGVFISADPQPKGKGEVLDMGAAVAQLDSALALVSSLARSAAASGALTADVEGQQALKQVLARMAGAGLVASAPAGMALTTAGNLQLSTGRNLTATAGDSTDISVFRRFSLAAGEAISLFAQKLGLKFFAAHGPVEIQAQTDAMTLQADKDMSLASVDGEIHLNARHGITLVSRGAYIKLKDGSIEIGAPGELRIRNDHIECGGAASLDKALSAMTPQDPVYWFPNQGCFQVLDKANGQPKPHVAYRLETGDGSVVRGVTDGHGYTQGHHGLEPQDIKVFFE